MKRRSVKVVSVAEDGLSMIVEGRPLSELGLDGARIVDELGRDVGPLEGFTVNEGETALEALRKAIPPNYSIVLQNRRLTLHKQ